MEIAIKNKSMHNFEKELLPDVFTGCSVAIGPLKVGIKKIAFLILNRIMFWLKFLWSLIWSKLTKKLPIFVTQHHVPL